MTTEVPPSHAKKCLLIDGNSLLYRAFFAIRFLSARDGQPTNALYGFANMLMKLLADPPDLFIVAFDAPARTFRKEMFEDYKVTRKPTPDELISQSPLARELAKSLGAMVLEIPGYEADDIVGTCACQAAACGFDVTIVTGDTDELQLVSDKITVMATTKGVTETVLYTPQDVINRYGMTPDQFVDYKALKGDTSDNIPGIPGVGDKTAAKLIQDFGSIDNLLENLELVPPGKVRQAIEDNKDQLLLSRTLATIVTNVPLEIPVQDAPHWARVPGEAEVLFRRLEFESLAKRLPPAGGIAPDLPQDEAPACPAPVTTELVENAARITELLNRISEEKTVTFLLEAGRGEGPEWLGVAFGDSCYGLRLQHKPAPVQGGLFGDSDEEFSTPVSAFKDVFQDSTIDLRTHDSKAACLSLAAAGVEMVQAEFDSLLAGFLLQPGKGSYTLESLISNYLQTGLPEDCPVWQSLAVGAYYLTHLYRVMNSEIIEKNLATAYRDIELPLAPALACVEQRGITLDAQYLSEVAATMATEASRLEAEICEVAGEVFNVGSTKQLGQILFDKLKLPAGKKTKTGYSTDAETLEFLSAEYEIAAKILQWRELTKLKNTYADALPRMVSTVSGRIHTSYNQTGAATGRLSSVDPNLQNIPIKSELGRQIRAAFIAPPGKTLLSADYSQIELRLLAHMSQDPELLRCYNEEIDVHTRTACALFNVEIADVTSEMRRRAKTINFSVIYGKSDFGLSKELGITVQEAHDYIQAYFRQYPRVKEFTNEVLEKGRECGYVETIFGRKRWFPELNARDRNIRSNAERAAFNAPLQGSAADIIKLAMIRLEPVLSANNRADMLLQVHDELVFEVEENSVEQVAGLVKSGMQDVCQLAVPLIADVKAGKNWRDMTAVAVAV